MEKFLLAKWNMKKKPLAVFSWLWTRFKPPGFILTSNHLHDWEDVWCSPKCTDAVLTSLREERQRCGTATTNRTLCSEQKNTDNAARLFSQENQHKLIETQGFFTSALIGSIGLLKEGDVMMKMMMKMKTGVFFVLEHEQHICPYIPEQHLDGRHQVSELCPSQDKFMSCLLLLDRLRPSSEWVLPGQSVSCSRALGIEPGTF